MANRSDDVTGGPYKIAVIGAGLVGARHAKYVADHPDCTLATIIDPRPEMAKFAEGLNSKLLPSIDAIDEQLDGVIVATPNHTHFSIGMKCAALGLPCLMEKPITDDLAQGRRLVDSFAENNVPLLIGHHRRYHPFVARAKELIVSQSIGTPVCGSIIWAVKKPDSYFEAGAWRLGEDGGPVMINFIHEIDLMRCIFGEVIAITALSSSMRRSSSVEDTTAMILTFASGFIATVMLSDAALTPWSFEGACAENPNIEETGVSSWRIGCTEGAFEFPLLKVWQNESGAGDWSKPLDTYDLAHTSIAPLRAQLDHFVALITNPKLKPHVSGEEGLKSLTAARAVLHSSKSGERVDMASFTESFKHTKEALKLAQ